MMSMPHGVMKHIQQYNCLQAPAEREQSTLELEVMCCPSVYSNISTQTRSTQLACLQAWIMSAPGSLHTTDPIYPYMAHSMAPSLGSQAALALSPQGTLILVCHRHPWSCHPRSPIMQKVSSCKDELCHHSCPT